HGLRSLDHLGDCFVLQNTLNLLHSLALLSLREGDEGLLLQLLVRDCLLWQEFECLLQFLVLLSLLL
ncbi:hypothetical protein PMAYCL1PPCAC_07641, partial [Pristionchus mayeri]